MKISVQDILRLTHREFRNAGSLQGRKLDGVSTDTRTLQAGNLFVALRGGRTDGHAHLAEAFTRGARAAVVAADADVAAVSTRPLLVVADTARALGELARLHRDRFDLPVIAVAGSNGKTTTKEMITAVLSTRYNVLSTEGNLNNHVGVPLTLFRLRKKHDVAVVEIGTNHPGEIAWLCEVLHPTHGLITTIGSEHLEFFGSLQGVAREEGTLFRALRMVPRGTAFVCADDPRIVALARGIRRIVTYGFTARRAQVKGRALEMDGFGRARFSLRTPRAKKPQEIRLAVSGEHHALNALAAAAVGTAFRVPAGSIRRALERGAQAGGRMETMDLEGVLIFNDTYNANPDSTLAALRTLAAARVSGKRIAVLADMLELGAAAPAEHSRIGRAVRDLGIEYLLTVGDLARHIHDAAGLATAVHYQQKNILAEFLAELIAPGDAVLVKGSRGMRMEDVIVFLKERLRSAVVPFG